jgi:hypothetical protein
MMGAIVLVGGMSGVMTFVSGVGLLLKLHPVNRMLVPKIKLTVRNLCKNNSLRTGELMTVDYP